MEKLKDKLFTKVIAFILVQMCVLGVVLSGVVIVFNAGYNLYSSSREHFEDVVVNEMISRFEYELFGDVYYADEYLYGSESLLKETELPSGVGYKVSFNGMNEKDLLYVDSEKNTKMMTNNPEVVVSETEHDVYNATVYMMNPFKIDESVEKLYPESLSAEYKLLTNMYSYRFATLIGATACLVALVVLMVFLISACKSSRESNIIKKFPADLAAVIAFTVVAITVYVITDYVSYFDYSELDAVILLFGCLILLVSAVCIGFLCLFIAKLKEGNWWKTSVLYFLIKLAKKACLWIWNHIRKTARLTLAAIKKLPLVWKTVLAVVIVLTSNLLVAINFFWSAFAVFFWVVGAIVIGVGVIYTSLCMKRLKEGGAKLAAGDLDFKIEKRGLFLDFAEHAEHLNCIGEGMANAVEERIKSERFKAELITNVSHDIKTPLTSIINYVDLLEKEEFEDEKIKEYIEVLDRQSKRLKKLTEDIVDASKASTGNVKIDFAPCKVGLLMSQTMAEYKEKAEAAGLEFIMKIPEEDYEILADGRRMWRVFDNLLNNICKYSQPGTRVYMTLENTQDKAVVTYRNVSKYELDITEEELMERFVRGDKSRNTEGSGLGLSIARNLVELQNGEFDIFIDGDLFKVVIKFNLLNL